MSGSGVRPSGLRSPDSGAGGDRVGGRRRSVPGPRRPRAPLPAPRLSTFLTTFRDFPLQGSNFSLLWLIPFSSHPSLWGFLSWCRPPSLTRSAGWGPFLLRLCEVGLGRGQASESPAAGKVESTLGLLPGDRSLQPWWSPEEGSWGFGEGWGGRGELCQETQNAEVPVPDKPGHLRLWRGLCLSAQAVS